MNLKLELMLVTLKSKDGYDVDVTSIYVKRLTGEITQAEYRSQLDTITTTNKKNLRS